LKNCSWDLTLVYITVEQYILFDSQSHNLYHTLDKDKAAFHLALIGAHSTVEIIISSLGLFFIPALSELVHTVQ